MSDDYDPFGEPLPERQVDEVPASVVPLESPIDGEKLADEEVERRVKARYGFAPSETRTRAERDAVAARMVAKSPWKDVPLTGFRSTPEDLVPSPEKLAKLHPKK